MKRVRLEDFYWFAALMMAFTALIAAWLGFTWSAMAFAFVVGVIVGAAGVSMEVAKS